jgi:hypothetical protein
LVGSILGSKGGLLFEGSHISHHWPWRFTAVNVPLRNRTA